MPERAFPLLFAADVSATARFYEKLGFSRTTQTPPVGEPTFIALRRGTSELAVVNHRWPSDQYGRPVGQGPCFEMFVFLDDVDAKLSALAHDGVQTIREPVDMPWGERIAYVTDPDGNPVALASVITTAPDH
jgi:lactoylglutathione lyase